ncbi:hypothetical protein AUC68_14700 [Methyloceanibacter methanicus]|uniref:Bacterial sugar transferase domain-containing protein n=1 Tax=Methyloceanibacter methanicus TaxID=1774968 RepID=A0A1E3W448_9HYPH|nr:undecaprenyl-phosphate glucose phosphotransferase [Methyloceanibacter methanicus]ODS00510.1 hypothetical protein AUC68_14700 [Methyloceanibacter methanicus]
MSDTLVSRWKPEKRAQNWKSFATELAALAAVATETAAIAAASVVSGLLYHLVAYGERGDVIGYFQVGTLAASIILISNLFRGEYRLSHFLSFKTHPRRLFQLWNATFACLLVLGFLIKASEDYSRGWLLLYYVTGFGTLLLVRYALVRLVRRAASAGIIATKRIFLIGTPQEVERFTAHFDTSALGIEIVGSSYLSDATLRETAPVRQEELSRDLATVSPHVRHLEPDAIFVLIPWSERDLIDRCVQVLVGLPCEVHIGPDHALQHYSNADLARHGPLASLQLVRAPLSRFDLLQKRVFDFFAAVFALAVAAPFMVVIAILIKLDSPGPVFFRQQRYGFNRKPFPILKFRTMTTLDDGPIVNQATRHDPRITRVGRWLRRLNLDELPQLLNVIRGEMSLVGPRPHAIAHDHEFEKVVDSYACRHNVKPGITGWAQVHGYRGETDTPDKVERRLEYDLFYIENWSLARDVLILFWTVFSATAYRNAF